jgi:hypothetical protein
MTAEIWDPTTRASGAARVVRNGQWFSKAVFLADGRLLVVGVGASIQDAQVWDPVTRKATSAGSMIGDRWRGETLTRLPDGRVLLVGGEDHASDDLQGLASAEVWDPATDTFARAGVLVDARTGHTATLLADGRVLIVGGTTAADRGRTLAGAEIWDPGTMTFAPAGRMAVARYEHTATLLPDGRVLVAGGHDDRRVFASTEVWDPVTETFRSSAAGR